MRVLAPKVHVEVFRPTQISYSNRSGRQSSVQQNPKYTPKTIRYIRVAKVEDRRIKGLQFEETALFGGFIEINIAEDPQSELFDKFLPNDHIEVFYNDTVKRAGEDENVFIHDFGIQKDYDFTSGNPKFQGATWKTDLKYRPTMVTTQLHAWDYLRILQYINIPRGERKQKLNSTIVIADNSEVGGVAKLKTSKTRLRYGDDMLDYIDSAINAFTDNHSSVSLFGQNLLFSENRSGNILYENEDYRDKIIFVPTSDAGKNTPIISFYNAGIGNYCHSLLRETGSYYSKFNEVYSATDKTWSERGFHNSNLSTSQTINNVTDAIDKMGKHDVLQFRFLDGRFGRFNGFVDDTEKIVQSESVHYVADIIAISQFALIELLVKKMVIDYNLNQWFTPVIRFDPEFLKEIEKLGTRVGKKISKLIFIRLRKVNEDNNTESTHFCFNIDTYPFVAEYTIEAFKLAVGNIVRGLDQNHVTSKSETDIFSEIFTTIDFPQQPLKEGEKSYSIHSLSSSFDLKDRAIKSQRQLYIDLKNRFVLNFSVDQEFENSSIPDFYMALMKRITSYSSFIQKVLSKDDKIISFIKNVPASFMRADIYTGSKFNTIQYDSLAITRIIQLIASNMAGFPATNNPVSNTEKGSINSYPVFAANRIVIKPKVYFGQRIIQGIPSRQFHYGLYSSLSELFKKKGYETEGNAACFLVLDIAKKKLKEKDDEPEFIFPMGDIQDFGIIKTSTVNHYFNFSLQDSWKDFKFLFPVNDSDPNKDVYKNVTENGIFIEYREGGLSSVGFSPPEHQQLKLSDLTQNSEYTSWAPRYAVNVNIESYDTSRPIFNPSIAYINRQNKKKRPILPNHLIINDYDTFGNLDVLFDKENVSSTYLNYANEWGSNENIPADNEVETIHPFYGITGYVDISDLKAEYHALELILISKDTSYRDIANVDLELMENIKIRVPLKFEYNDIDFSKYPYEKQKYSDKIKFISPSRPGKSSKVFGEESIKRVIIDINKQLNKINEIDMIWLFPYSGFLIEKATGNLVHTKLDDGVTNATGTWLKHLFLITYLDLLIKGIRYMLWSLAKARFFCHVYIPIEYKNYSTRTPDNMNYSSAIVEPGSSVQIRYNEETSSLFKTIENPLVAFPIKGLEKGDKAYLPLYRTISRGTKVGLEDGAIVETSIESNREMTWYVSKKVTYIGADTGAMMRVEMTEGSLDWTLFFNEKNLLTQVSEHYLLNGLGNFRTGAYF